MTLPPRTTPAGFGRPAVLAASPTWTRTNVVAVTVAVLLFVFVLGTSYENYVRDQAAEQNGIELAEASQNARSGLDLIAGEIQTADAAGIPAKGPRILVASQFRITFACDLNGNGRLDLGEVITYFLDPNWRDAPISSKPNPYGFVLRRKVGSVGDSLATPTLGEGEIVAYGLSQRSSDRVTTKDVSLFSYRDSSGTSLELDPSAPTDPAGVFFGCTVAAAPPVGRGRAQAQAKSIESIRVRLVAETKEKDPDSGRYDRVTVGTTVLLGERRGSGMGIR
ncbi:MAG: hypothetical protein ACRENN_02515 [Candidatus Eiseniibacteriota bacterium]